MTRAVSHRDVAARDVVVARREHADLQRAQRLRAVRRPCVRLVRTHGARQCDKRRRQQQQQRDDDADVLLGGRRQRRRVSLKADDARSVSDQANVADNDVTERRCVSLTHAHTHARAVLCLTAAQSSASAAMMSSGDASASWLIPVVVVGALVGLLLLAGGVALLVRRRRNADGNSADYNGGNFGTSLQLAPPPGHTCGRFWSFALTMRQQRRRKPSRCRRPSCPRRVTLVSTKRCRRQRSTTSLRRSAAAAVVEAAVARQ